LASVRKPNEPARGEAPTTAIERRRDQALKFCEA